MKTPILFILSFTLLLQLGTSQNGNLSVADTLQSGALSGTNNRIVQAGPNGELDGLPEGNLGEVLSQGQTGPQWAAMSGSSSPTSNCVPYACPSEMSLTSANTMTYGECLRYCYALDENSQTDWRTPSLDEVFLLMPQTPLDASETNIWTTTIVTFGDNFYVNPINGNDFFNVPLQIGVSINSGRQTFPLSSITNYKCKCVR